MIIALEEAKRRLASLEESVRQLRDALHIEALTEEAMELEAKTYAPDFWGDQETSGKILQTLKQTKETIENYENLVARYEVTKDMI